MDLLHLLQSRRSTPSRLLHDPGPDANQLRRMLESALRVPDHGRLEPWRFILIRGSTRAALGELVATRGQLVGPGAPPAVAEKDRQRFSHAPLVVTVVARLTAGHKVPEQEQLLSGGALCLQLLHAANAMGFGAQWLTGWAAYDSAVASALGLLPNERVLGFIHVGSTDEQAPERVRPDPDSLTTELVL